MPIKIIQWRNVSVKRKFYWFIQIKQVKSCTECKRANYGGLSRDGVHGSSGYSAHVDTPLHQNVALDTPNSWPGVADDPENEKWSSHLQMLIQRIFEIKITSNPCWRRDRFHNRRWSPRDWWPFWNNVSRRKCPIRRRPSNWRRRKRQQVRKWLLLVWFRLHFELWWHSTNLSL